MKKYSNIGYGNEKATSKNKPKKIIKKLDLQIPNLKRKFSSSLQPKYDNS